MREGWNLPYEDAPGLPVEYQGSFELAGGVHVLAALPEHPVTGERMPALLFRFVAPEGQALGTFLLVLEKGQYQALVKLVRDAVDGALRGAAKVRRRKREENGG